MVADAVRIDERVSPSRAAAETIRKTLVDEDGMISIPIDVDEVAHRLGIDVRRMRLDSQTDGILVKDGPGKRFKAVIDAFAHPHRARFTLAHEIGHFVHKYQDVPKDAVVGKVEYRDARSSAGVDEEEIWANGFAAALLMPAGIVSKMVGDGYGVRDIARALNVSEQAADLRCSVLRLR